MPFSRCGPVCHNQLTVLLADLKNDLLRQRQVSGRNCRFDQPVVSCFQSLKHSAFRRFDGLFPQMERWGEVQADGMEAGYWRDYFQTVESVTPQELRQLAQQYLDPEGMTTVLVGPRP